MYEPPLTQPLPEAPGAKASRTCGMLAIILGVLLAPVCIGLPIALILGIVAIVKSGSAKRIAANHPEAYAPPTSSGFVMGIVGVVLPILLLPFIGIVSAIAIPALLSQRGRVRDKATIMNMTGRLADLAGQYDKLKESNKTPAQIKAGLETYLQETGGADKNPWNLAQPAYSYSIAVVDGITPGTSTAPATLPTPGLGQSVFMIQFKSDSQPGYLAGCAQLTNSFNDSKFYFKKIEVE